MRTILSRAPILAPMILLAACNTVDATATSTVSPSVSDPGRKFQAGSASWYQMGRRTANGEAFNPNGMTAAHRNLPFGTRVRVVHESSGRSVVVRINDRGPFSGSRIIDLARGPAQALGLTRSGVAYVSLHRLD
jgi:rare lipoprotein A